MVKGKDFIPFAAVTYTISKDTFLTVKKKRRKIKRLEINLSKLTTQMVVLKSRKKQIDQLNRMSISREKSEEYNVRFGIEFEKLQDKYKKLVTDYISFRGSLEEPSTTSLGKDHKLILEVLDLDASSAGNFINAILKRKTSIFTRKFLDLSTLSARILELYDYVSQVNKEVNEKTLLIDTEPEIVQEKHGICELPTLKENAGKVLRLIERADLKVIGIVGEVGAGKTTLLKMLNNELKDAQNRNDNSLKFDFVIWITYPDGLDTYDKKVQEVQNEIMTRLRIDKEQTKSIDQNAVKISTFLHEKRYILLLDQVESGIDLDRIGIQKEHRFGKVVVASSSRIITNRMKVDEAVEMHELGKQDVFILFEHFCGKIANKPIKCLAQAIAERCGGLPLVIELVATSLKGNKDETFWISMRDRMDSLFEIDFLGLDVLSRAYRMLYEGLKNDHVKKCLLYTALFPPGHKINIDYLVECWRAEGFLEKKHVKNLRDARDEGAMILNELTSKYLLHKCFDDKHVKLPVLLRTIALEENYPGEQSSAVWVMRKDEHPEEETWRTTKRMSLIHQLPNEHARGNTSMLVLPKSPECENLSTLFLSSSLEELESDFFVHMEKLVVLDMYRTRINLLPPSISNLANLVNLYLNGCSNLRFLPSEVKELPNLEVLDIRKTSIYPWLPQEIGSLDGLRCLRVSFRERVGESSGKGKEKSPCDIISNLTKLEELIIEDDSESDGWKKIADEIVVAVASLKYLTTLYFNFPCEESLHKYSSLSTATRPKCELRAFRFYVGNRYGSSDISRILSRYGSSDISGILCQRHLVFSSTDDEISCSSFSVIKRTTALELIDRSDVKSLSDYNIDDMETLRFCKIHGCKSVTSIVDTTEVGKWRSSRKKQSADGIFPSLEKLILEDLPSLEYIWKGTVFSGSFLSLTVLKLCDCPKLEEITFMNWALLKEIFILRCKLLTMLSVTPDSAKSLNLIECEASWWTQLQLSEEDKHRFAHICRFIDEEGPLDEGGSKPITTDQRSAGAKDDTKNEKNEQQRKGARKTKIDLSKNPIKVLFGWRRNQGNKAIKHEKSE